MEAGGGRARLHLNIFATIAHRPPVLEAWIRTGAAVISPAAHPHPADVVERVILWTAAACGSRYIAARHRLIATACGLTADDLRRVHEDGIHLNWLEGIDLDAALLPVLEFYAFAALVAEILDVQPDADIGAEWPERPANYDWIARADAIAALVSASSPSVTTSTLRHVAAAVAASASLDWPERLTASIRSKNHPGAPATAQMTSLPPAVGAVLAALNVSSADGTGSQAPSPAAPPDLVDAAVIAAIAAVAEDKSPI